LPLIRELQTIIEDDVILQPGNLPNTADIFGTHVGQLSCNYPLLADGLPCKICEIASDWATIEYTGDIEEPVEVAIRQQQFAISPFDIAKQLTEYWIPIWQGDEPAQDLFDDSHILDLVQTLPPHPDIDINMLDTESWQKAIHKLKHKAARGIDSISAVELSLLPEPLVAMLAKLCTSIRLDFHNGS